MFMTQCNGLYAALGSGIHVVFRASFSKMELHVVTAIASCMSDVMIMIMITVSLSLTVCHITKNQV